MVLSAVLAGLILRFGFSGERNFEDAALGTMTVSYEARSIDGRDIHTTKQREKEIAEMLSVASDGRRSTLILGNSQTHSINQKKEGEVVYPEILDRAFSERTVLTNSLPNANLQEFYLILNWWLETVIFDQIVVPVFMDDLREDGLREDFLTALIQENFALSGELDDFDQSLNEQLRSLQPQTHAESSESSDSETPQDFVEKEINSWLAAHSKTWANRPNARGDLFMKLYAWRNILFNISATTKRKMIPARMSKNLLALDRILERTSEDSIDVLLYIPPIRRDVEVPYDLAEYAQFKSEVESMAAAYSHVQFKNWEGIVPGELWGLKASTNGKKEPELDFMHFQFKGHQILADSILTALKP